MPQTDLSPPTTYTAQAKAILAGEHFVLHGVPAIATPVPGLHLTMRLALRTGPELVLPEPYSDLSFEVSAILDHRISGYVRLTITSNIPQGAGLGSSAAFAVALGQNLCEHAGFPSDEHDKRALRIANLIEQKIHHRASGVDTAVISLGKAISFSLNERGETLVQKIHVEAPMSFLLIDSTHRRATHEQISKVCKAREANINEFNEASEKARISVQDLLKGLETNTPESVEQAIRTSGTLLRELGLEHESAQSMRESAEDLGVALKITGAGGGGYMLAYAKEPEKLTKLKEKLDEHVETKMFQVMP
jgi:mevalonate kinase